MADIKSNLSEENVTAKPLEKKPIPSFVKAKSAKKSAAADAAAIPKEPKKDHYAFVDEAFYGDNPYDAYSSFKERYSAPKPITLKPSKEILWDVPMGVASGGAGVVAGGKILLDTETSFNSPMIKSKKPDVAVAGVMDAVAVEAMNAIPEKPKLPSLRAFITSGNDLEASIWTNEMISEALNVELWRVREIDETIREHDIICVISDNVPLFMCVQGWKDTVITQEQIDIHNYTVYTLEGAGKKKKPLFDKSTSQFAGMLCVPKGVQLKLPTDESEARRFFGCDVIVTELFEKGRPIKCFYPIPCKMADKTFRVAFSRIFVDFARKHYREHIKGLIPGRGDGIHLKRGVSTKKILNAIQNGLSIENACQKFNLPQHTIASLVIKHGYGQGIKDNAIIPFIKRMNNRNLTPMEFRYDKALGIEIETLSPVSGDEAQKHIPSFMRVAQDLSIKNAAGQDANGKNGSPFGVEFRILIKRSEMETRTMKAVDAINRLNCTVNKTCGLHVHFDMRDKTAKDVEKLAAKLVKWLMVLQELVPASRRTNKYCQLVNFEKPHWAGVSTSAYEKHKTLEIRTHSSTTNHIKIIQWIRLIETLIETKFAPLPNTSTIDGIRMLNLTEADRTFWLKRHQQLNPNLYKDGKLDLSFLGDKQNEEE